MKIPILYKILGYGQLREENIRLVAESNAQKKIINQFIRELRMKMPASVSSLEIQESQLDDRHKVLLGIFLNDNKKHTANDLATITNRPKKAVSNDLADLYSWGYLERKREGRKGYVYWINIEVKDKLTSVIPSGI